MNKLDESIIYQYSSPEIFDSVKNALIKMNKNLDELTLKDLAPVDFFHIRGYQSTKELAELCNIKPDMKILDVGCGIGGTARFLASQYGSFVTGLDIMEEYCQTADKLSTLLKFDDKTEFKMGDGSELTFEDESFDLVWTEHVQMNIKDKRKFFSEIYCVLKKGGKLVFHDVFNGNNGPVYYPVPWADDEAISFLLNRTEMEKLLESISFTISFIEDRTEISAEAFQKSVENIKRDGSPLLGLHLLMGENTMEKILNMSRNLVEKRVSVLQCICVK
jgi:ubiquinone/menaquinone biosynthesis C-methylase UbiE